MFIYNVTIALDAEIEDQWVQWMQSTHIPEMLQTGCFTEACMHKVLHSANETGHPSYAVQYKVNSYKELENYYKNHANDLRNKAFEAFSDKFIALRTELEEVYLIKNQAFE